MSALAELTQKFRSVWPLLGERKRRVMVVNEAIEHLGYGGVSLVRRACGLSRRAIAKGIASHRRGPSRRRASRSFFRLSRKPKVAALSWDLASGRSKSKSRQAAR